jgi:hypothetical protein
MRNATRGMGHDRRPLITIDGTRYMRHGPVTPPCRVDAMLSAKARAWVTLMSLAELILVGCIVAGLTVGLVAMAPETYRYCHTEQGGVRTCER